MIGRWDELIRFLCLDLTRDLGRDVSHLLPAAQRTPAGRQQALRDSLTARGELHAELRIPDAIAPMSIVANLGTRQVTASARVAAPGEGRSKGRVSWLLRQLADAGDSVIIEARVARGGISRAAVLGKAREDPSLRYPEDAREIKEFVVSLSRDMGLKRDASRKSFIQSVLLTAKEFYATVLQELTAWKPRAPKLSPKTEEPSIDEIEVEVRKKPVVEAIEEARAEMEGLSEHADAPRTDGGPEDEPPPDTRQAPLS